MNNQPNQPMETEAVYHHRLPIQIRFNDVDRYGHVNNCLLYTSDAADE